MRDLKWENGSLGNIPKIDQNADATKHRYTSQL